MWFVVFYLNQISVHDNQLMLLLQNWCSTGYIVMYIHCTVLQLQKNSFSGANINLCERYKKKKRGPTFQKQLSDFMETSN